MTRTGTRRAGRPLRAMAAFGLLLACAPSDPAPRHLVLITVDTLRADRLGSYGYVPAETPAIDDLAARALRFERAYAHASATAPSIASLLTGLLPAEHGALNNGSGIREGIPTLAQRLGATGFSSAAFVGSWALRRGRGFERSFEAYTRTFSGREAVRPQPENPGERLTRQVLEWLAERDRERRFFLWVHYQEPHGPYTPPRFDASRAAADARELPRNATNSGRGAIPNYQWLGHGRLGEYLARYDGEVAETDRQIARLLAGLRERDLLDQTLVIFTADHGEAFGEENLFLAHGEGLGEALVRVPLLLCIPGARGGVRTDVVRLIDVAPTALELLGIDATGLPGRSLLVDDGDRLAASQLEPLRGHESWRAVRDGRFELRETRPGAPVLRDLALGGAAVAPGDELEARARLGAALEKLAPWASSPARPTLSDRDREALRALGYLD